MRHRYVDGMTLMELLVVLAIIGIIMMMAVPRFMNVVGDARSLEAQQQLKYLYTLEKTYFFRNAKYSDDALAISYEQPKLATDGGNAYFRVDITEASVGSFLATATAVVDFDGDGAFNVWTIDQDQNLVEVVKD